MTPPKPSLSAAPRAPSSADATHVYRPGTRGGPDAIQALLTFHKRLRLAFATLRRLSKLPADRIDHESVCALYEFFKEDVAQHDLDEEASLMPRLRRAPHPPRLERLLAACTRQHEHLETAVEALLPHLQAASTGLIQVDPARLHIASEELERALIPHLTLEEQEIFPMARLLLGPDEIAQIGREMEARRRARAGGTPRAVALYPSPASHSAEPEKTEPDATLGSTANGRSPP